MVVLTRRAMSSLTEVQLATEGLKQAGSVALTLRHCSPLQGERITSGSIVRRGGEPSAKKGRRRKEINMKTSLKFDL